MPAVLRGSGAGMMFPGIPPKSRRFLSDLGENNNRDWFMTHRDEYERSLKAPMTALVVDVAGECARRGIPLTIADPAKAIMRINRDVRFARDKSPYKTNVAACLTRSGRRHDAGMLYLHVAADEAFAACGFYEFDTDQLAAFREAICAQPAAWTRMEASLAEAGFPLSDEGALKRLPRGFEDAPPTVATAIRRRFFVSKLQLDDDDLRQPALSGKLGDFADINRHLLEFGWSAL